MIFIDESRFGFHSNSRRTRAEDRICLEVYAYRGDTIMAWGGIMIGGKTELDFPDRLQQLGCNWTLFPFICRRCCSERPSNV